MTGNQIRDDWEPDKGWLGAREGMTGSQRKDWEPEKG